MAEPTREQVAEVQAVLNRQSWPLRWEDVQEARRLLHALLSRLSAEPTVQVPMSLIERTVDALAFEGINVPELAALLSQPTTDEPKKPEFSDAQYREADEAWMWYADEAEFHVHDVVQEQFIEGYLAALKKHPAPQPPTREQIAEALFRDDANHEDEMWSRLQRESYLKNADAVLALIQNGAE